MVDKEVGNNTCPNLWEILAAHSGKRKKQYCSDACRRIGGMRIRTGERKHTIRSHAPNVVRLSSYGNAKEFTQPFLLYHWARFSKRKSSRGPNFD